MSDKRRSERTHREALNTTRGIRFCICIPAFKRLISSQMSRLCPPRRPFNFQKPPRNEMRNGDSGAGRNPTGSNRERGYKATTERGARSVRFRARKMFELRCIEEPEKEQGRFRSGFLWRQPEKTTDFAARRALRARGGRVRKYKAEDFLEGGFFGGGANANAADKQGVLAPPTRARTLAVATSAKLPKSNENRTLFVVDRTIWKHIHLMCHKNMRD